MGKFRQFLTVICPQHICIFENILLRFFVFSEPITVEIYLVNPLKVTLTLTDVMLLWSFLPTIASHDKPQPITNEHLITAKVSTWLFIRCFFFQSKILIVFLFLHKNICCGYSLEYDLSKCRDGKLQD